MSATTTTVDAPKTSEEEGVNTGATTTGQAPAPVTSGESTPKTEEKTLTQADVDRIVETRLAEQKRKNDAKLDSEKKAAAEKAAIESGEWKALYEGAKETIATLERERDEANLNTARERVAAKHKLPPALAARLRGADEASLDADAKELAKLVRVAAPNTEAGAGSNGGAGSATRVEQLKDELRKSGRYASVS
jgi:hypothetical protein